MRYLILSDIHSNSEALSAVLSRVRRKKFDRVVILGDFVGYGANPNQVIDRIREIKKVKIMIRGNHDKVVCGVESGDLFNPVAGRRFDLIVSNPPYVPSRPEDLPARGLSRAWEAGPRGRTFLDRICSEAADYLTAYGLLLLVHSSVCGERETLAALQDGGLAGEVVERNRGPLGVRLTERAAWLREQGLLEGDHEEILLVQARRTRQPADGRDRLLRL